MRLAILTLLLLVPFSIVAEADTAAPDVPAQDVAGLVEQLGHPLYAERLDARRRLLDVGLAAFDALRDAQDDADPEVSDASRRLLGELTADWARRDDPPLVRQWLAAYDAGYAGRDNEIIKGLSRVPGEQAVPALARLARFEPTEIGSAEAARVLLAVPERAISKRREEAITAAVTKLTNDFGPGRRPAAQWLALAVKEPSLSPPSSTGGSPTESSSTEATSYLTEWRRHAESQRTLLDASSSDTSEEVVATLAWRWLRAALAAGDDTEAVSAIESLVTLSDEESLPRLSRCVRWAAETERWDAIDEVVAKYAERLKGKRGLYILADVALRRGNNEQAERLAAEALAAAPSDEDMTVEDVLLGPQVMVASELQELGRVDWAVAEYREAAKSDDPLDGRAAVAAWQMAQDLLFDAGRYAEAAAALEPIVEAIDRSRPARGEYDNLPQHDTEPPLLPSSGDLISRQRFSAALAARAEGDQEKEMTLLRKAIAASPSDADVLIAMYRVKDAPEAFATETRRRIDERRREFERVIWENPAEPDGYNQWAWLVGNTYGDFDKAVRYSRQSLRIRPEDPGLLDTLGRCLFSAGRIEEAIETQRRAVELKPRMQVLRRQLEEFEKAKASTSSEEATQ
jgi:tetratricopeptide (TPR) repeat protein